MILDLQKPKVTLKEDIYIHLKLNTNQEKRNNHKQSRYIAINTHIHLYMN